MSYSNFEIDRMLRSMYVIVDTREQDTERFRYRMKNLGCPYIREALSYGDYSVGYTDINGQKQDLRRIVVIERKMNLDELCNCFTSGRARFEKEFKRARQDHAKVHLLVEDGNYEKMFDGKYRSKMHPNSLIASYLAWAERFNIQLHFCKKETTPKLINKILHYSLKVYLEGQIND